MGIRGCQTSNKFGRRKSRVFWIIACFLSMHRHLQHDPCLACSDHARTAEVLMLRKCSSVEHAIGSSWPRIAKCKTSTHAGAKPCGSSGSGRTWPIPWNSRYRYAFSRNRCAPQVISWTLVVLEPCAGHAAKGTRVHEVSREKALVQRAHRCSRLRTICCVRQAHACHLSNGLRLSLLMLEGSEHLAHHSLRAEIPPRAKLRDCLAKEEDISSSVFCLTQQWP